MITPEVSHDIALLGNRKIPGRCTHTLGEGALFPSSPATNSASPFPYPRFGNHP